MSAAPKMESSYSSEPSRLLRWLRPYSEKRDVSVCPSVRLSVPSFF